VLACEILEREERAQGGVLAGPRSSLADPWPVGPEILAVLALVGLVASVSMIHGNIGEAKNEVGSPS
jgi:hypothetical protein